MKIMIVIGVIIALEASTRADTPTAEDLYAEGQTAYDRADFAVAIAKWSASYDLSGESGLLFNLAQAYRLSGDCTNALATYKRFVSIDTTADQRPLALDFVRELEPRCGEPILPIQTTIVDHPVDRPVARQGRTLKFAGLATGSAGIASLAIGLGLGHHASVLGDQVTHDCATSCDWATEKSKDAAGRRDAAIGRVLDVTGVAAIAGGAILYYLGDREHAITVAPLSARSGAVVSWSGSW